MLANLFMLAQDESTIFNLRNGLLLVLIIGILIGYKIYKDKTMG